MHYPAGSTSEDGYTVVIKQTSSNLALIHYLLLFYFFHFIFFINYLLLLFLFLSSCYHLSLFTVKILLFSLFPSLLLLFIFCKV